MDFNVVHCVEERRFARASCHFVCLYTCYKGDGLFISHLDMFLLLEELCLVCRIVCRWHG